MNELLQQSILDAFSEIQKWNQQFIIDDAGNSVDLASATLGQQSTDLVFFDNRCIEYNDVFFDYRCIEYNDV